MARGVSNPVTVKRVIEALPTQKTMQEVADYAGCSRQHVYWLIANNEEVAAAFKQRKGMGKLTAAEASDHRRAAIERLRKVVDEGDDKNAIAAASKLLAATATKPSSTAVASTPEAAVVQTEPAGEPLTAEQIQRQLEAQAKRA